MNLKNKNTLKYLLLAALPFPIMLLYFWVKQNVEKLLDYCYKINGIKINEISKSKINLDLFLIFKNLSKFKYKIKNVNGKLYIENEFITEFEIKSNDYIEPQKQKDILININADFSGIKLDLNKISSLLKIVSKYLKDKDNLLISFDLKIEIDIFGNTIYIPIYMPYTIKEMMENKPSNCKIE